MLEQGRGAGGGMDDAINNATRQFRGRDPREGGCHEFTPKKGYRRSLIYCGNHFTA
jgi:hypothetical protein